MKYELEINGDIASWLYSKSYVRYALSGYQGKHVNVRIASQGGSVFHALDIRQQFIDHGDVTAYLFGPVASSATIIAMGAKKVCMSNCALFLIHKVSNWVEQWGYFNADQIAELIKKLDKNKEENDKYDEILVALYCQKTGKSAQDIKDLLSESKWLSAQEAKEWGFVDEIIEEGEKIEVDDKVNALFALRGFPAIPDSYKDIQIASDQPAGNPDESKFFDRIKGYIDGLFKNKDKSNHTNNKKTMKTNYVKVNTLLNVQGVEVDASNNVTLSETNIKTINDRLDTLESEKTNLENEKSQLQADKTNLENEITNLKNQIAELQKQPGDKTDKVEPEEDKFNYVETFTPKLA